MSIDPSSPDFDPNLCTIQTCPIAYATVLYDPNLAGNALYLSIFSVLLVAQVYLGIRYRTWGFLAAFIGGLALEIIGYVARVQMHYNPFLANPFLMYIICLTIAPCFLSAGIYLCLARIVVVYGENLSRFSPRTYTITFISCDIFSLILQAAGGAITDTATSNPSLQKTGINIMIAGLSCQVVSLAIFIALSTDFAWSVYKRRNDRNLMNLSCSKSMFHGFLYALALATLLIFIRSCYRVAELQGGFGSSLANNQVTFMILEGAMVVTASIFLTVAHPGLIFGGSWNLAKARVLATGQRGSEVELGKGHIVAQQERDL